MRIYFCSGVFCVDHKYLSLSATLQFSLGCHLAFASNTILNTADEDFEATTDDRERALKDVCERVLRVHQEAH